MFSSVIFTEMKYLVFLDLVIVENCLDHLKYRECVTVSAVQM